MESTQPEQQKEKRKELYDIVKVLRKKTLHQEVLYPARLSFKIEGEIKSFPAR